MIALLFDIHGNLPALDASIRLHVGRRSEELHGLGDDLDRLAFGPVPGLVLPPLQPTVDRDRPALG